MAVMTKERNGKRVLYLTAEDWFFKTHFLHFAKAAQKQGYVVGLATSFSKGHKFSETGLQLFPLPPLRHNRSLLSYLHTLPHFISSLRSFKPHLVHVIGLQNILMFAPLIKIFSSARLVLAPIGLGQFWVERSIKAKPARTLIRTVLLSLRGKRIFYLFENDEDAAELNLDQFSQKKTIGGAGVDENYFQTLPFPTKPPVRIAVTSRMLHAKGILQCAAAVYEARRRGYNVVLDLWGLPDPANASSLTEDELRELSHNGVTWHGSSSAIREVWAKTHIAMLLSRREGMPKSLLEAAACGRPIITSNVPGCRTLVRDGKEGLLVEADNINIVVEAIIKLATSPSLREDYGAAARRRIFDGFTEAQVAQNVVMTYDWLLLNNAGA